MTTKSGLVFHVREIKPKDFYLAQILRQQKQSFVPLFVRMVLNTEVLDIATITETRSVVKWVLETLVDNNIFSVENWLETGFHMCKQRWDSTMDWLEEQPMSKIQTMLSIQEKFAKEQEKEMKKSAKKK